MVGNVYVLGIQIPNKLLLHCIPISVAKPDFMLHLLHNILVQILWCCCVCGSINVLRAKPGEWEKERKGRQIHRGEWEREGGYEWVPDFLWDSGRFFQFHCGINKDFPHWAAWECCFSPTPPAPCSLLATVSPSCDDIFQLRKDHKALSKAVCRATTTTATRRTSRMTPSSSSGCQLEVSF